MSAETGSSKTPTVIAIGDLHGYYPALKRLLEAIDRHYRIFSPENPDRLIPGVTLVFTGDYIDRGDSALEIIERLRRLQAENPRRVITLFGNHELIALEAYDVARDLAKKAGSQSATRALEEYGARTIHGHPGNGGQHFILEFGSSARAALKDYVERMSRNGDVGRWMRGLFPYYEARIGKRRVLFVHADLSEELLRPGVLERYKEGLLEILRTSTEDMGGTAKKYGHDWLMMSAGIFWCRSFLKLKDASTATIKGICRRAGVDLIVTGHTPRPPRIVPYGGRIFDIDVGMSDAFWSRPDHENVPWALLLWRNGRVAGFSANGEEQEFRAKGEGSDDKPKGQLAFFVEVREKS